MAYSTILDKHGADNANQLILDLEGFIEQNEEPPFLFSYYLSMKIYYRKKAVVKAKDLGIV